MDTTIIWWNMNESVTFQAKSDELKTVLEAKKAAGNAENALEASNLYLKSCNTREK